MQIPNPSNYQCGTFCSHPQHLRQCTQSCHAIHYSPRKTTKHIDIIQTNFIRGTTSVKRKTHVVSWDTITMDKNICRLYIDKADTKSHVVHPRLLGDFLRTQHPLGQILNFNILFIQQNLNTTNSHTQKCILNGWCSCTKP